MPRRSADHTKRAEAYQHDDQAMLRPEAGTQAQFKKRRPDRRYRCDSSVSPALDWDAQNPARELGEWLLVQIEEGNHRLIVALTAVLCACGSSGVDGGSSPSTVTPSEAPASSAPDRLAFCDHLNIDLLNALNLMSSGPAKDIQPSLDALAAVATEIRQDAKSHDPQLHAFAVQILGGIAQLADMIQRAGTLNVINSQGLGPAFTDATIAVGDYCPA